MHYHCELIYISYHIISGNCPSWTLIHGGYYSVEAQAYGARPARPPQGNHIRLSKAPVAVAGCRLETTGLFGGSKFMFMLQVGWGMMICLGIFPTTSNQHTYFLVVYFRISIHQTQAEWKKNIQHTQCRDEKPPEAWQVQHQNTITSCTINVSVCRDCPWVVEVRSCACHGKVALPTTHSDNCNSNHPSSDYGLA